MPNSNPSINTPATLAFARAAAQDRIRACLDQCEQVYNRTFDTPEIEFDLHGRTAGQFRVRGKKLIIRINPESLVDHPGETFGRTIPHEVAHLVDHVLFKGRAHGDTWRAIMRDVFNIDPEVYHTMELTPARKVRREYVYTCGCREHKLTAIRHNRIRRGMKYRCRTCGGLLKHKDS